MRAALLLLLLIATPTAARPLVDYTAANATLGPPAAGERRVVFVGDSITLFWPERSPGFFAAKSRIGRGQATGETSTQLRARFDRDVIALHPAAVHILSGINDIARNRGELPAATLDNLRAMGAAARAAGIRVILGSLLPCDRFLVYPDARPAAAVRALNAALAAEAKAHGDGFADYYPALSTADGGLRPEYSRDGLHPNAAGYAVMERVLKPLLPR